MHIQALQYDFNQSRTITKSSEKISRRWAKKLADGLYNE